MRSSYPSGSENKFAEQTHYVTSAILSYYATRMVATLLSSLSPINDDIKPHKKDCVESLENHAAQNNLGGYESFAYRNMNADWAAACAAERQQAYIKTRQENNNRQLSLAVPFILATYVGSFGFAYMGNIAGREPPNGPRPQAA